MTFLRRAALASMVTLATALGGCTTLLGDFQVGTGDDASTGGDGGAAGDAQVGSDGGDGDSTTMNDGPAPDTGAGHLVVDKMTLDFATHTLSSMVPAMTVTVTNTGTATTGTLTVTVTGSSFARSGGSCMGPLAPSARCTVDVTINTTRTGMQSGSVVIADGASDMVSASLTGNIVMSCPVNMPTLCNGSTCVDTVTDPLNCNMCGNRCPTVPNGTGGCAASACGVGMCNTGFQDCNGMASDGCEVGTTNDPSHCGSCARQCTVANGQPGCVNSACTVASCSNGFSDCNMMPGDGCEVNTTNDVMHCGTCAGACNLPNAVPVCSGATCKVQSCNGTFADCNMNAGDGCEIDTSSNAAHCGSCATACSATFSCVASACACAGALPNACAGACKNFQTDPNNCGACGHDCLGGGCSAGACQPVLIGTIAGMGTGLSVEQGAVFFAAGGTSAYKCSASGCAGNPFAVANGFTTAGTVFADVPSGFVFVADQNGGALVKINPNGGARLFTITAQTNARGSAADGNFVYWGATNTIGRANKFDGSGVTTVASGLGFVYGLTFDPNTGALFAADYSANGQVIRCNNPGAGGCGGAWTNLATSQPYPTQVTVAGGNVYWTRLGTPPGYNDGGLLSTPVGGGSVTANATGPTYSFAFGATSDANYVYFAGGSNINRTALGSFGATVIASGVGTARAVANDPVAVYWIDDSGNVKKVAK